MSAGRHCTRVFGTNMYMPVKNAVTITYGATAISVPGRRCRNGILATSCTGALAMVACDRPMNATSNTGPTTSSVRYSAIRRAKLRGCSTRHRKLKLSSTFLDRAEQCPGEQRKAHRADDAAADPVGKLHDPPGQLGGGLFADRAEELVDDGLQVAMRAEHFQDGETEGEQGNQRQQGGVDQSHGAQIDLAAPQVADHGVRITQRPDQQRRQPRAGRGRPEETPVEECPDP